MRGEDGENMSKLKEFTFSWRYALAIVNGYSGTLKTTGHVIDFLVDETPCTLYLSGREDSFIEKLEKLGIDEWDGQDFFTPGVLDGDTWDLTIAYDEKKIHASGTNAYPPHFFDFMDLLHEYGLPVAGIEEEGCEEDEGTVMIDDWDIKIR